ncbi:MAG: hypothetical protein M1826_001210 [Phylliscum demangeonii]|nr:MAG: hypothetical protein M1826_001210 [Phylliscum demangeonii]
MAVVAARSHLLEPLREFVKHVGQKTQRHKDHDILTVQRKPVWGTCAGLILLAESANRTKRGGQDLIGGIDVRVNRNHFGRQVESFETDLDLPFLARGCATDAAIAPQQPFKAVFIRAPVVERILSPRAEGARDEEAQADDASVIAPPRIPEGEVAARLAVQEVEIMATVRPRGPSAPADAADAAAGRPKGDIVAVRQGNVFATSFHPELTGDPRIHTWWLQEVLELAERAQKVVK